MKKDVEEEGEREGREREMQLSSRVSFSSSSRNCEFLFLPFFLSVFSSNRNFVRKQDVVILLPGGWSRAEDGTLKYARSSALPSR